MNYLMHPQDLVFQAKAYIAGFAEMVRDEEVPQWDLLQVATDVAEEWTEEWDEEEGFGSSDRTYMIKSFVDEVIWQFCKEGKYMTAFRPGLKVVEYSEASHHRQVQELEA